MKINHGIILSVALAVLLTVTTGCSALTATNTSTTLRASGLIEATEVNIAPAVSGRVIEVPVAEGDTVKTGDTLLKIDGALLQSQRQTAAAGLTAAQAGVQVAQAALDSAQTQYTLAQEAATGQDQADLLSTLQKTASSALKLPDWYYPSDERISAAQAEIQAADTALQQAQDNLDGIKKNAGSNQFLQAETQLAQARSRYNVAKTVLDQSNKATSSGEVRDAAQSALDDAQSDLENAQKTYDDTITTEGAQDVLIARAKVTVAQERDNAARIALAALQTGSHSLELQAASQTVDQASAALQQAKAAVDQAKADLDFVDAQIAQLTVTSPLDGVVLTRSAQPGEILQAGMTGLSLASLDHLTVTVYIPENQYGQVSLGEQAVLTVNSFPGQNFSATVSRISDQAEFTPRNVQTTDQRQTTVYAVQLGIQNVDGRLKPGMPVDVEFTPAP